MKGNKEKNKLFYQKNRVRLLAAHKRYKAKIRLQALAAYGNQCKCCGEKTTEFLCLDHKNNDGRKHRKETKNGTMYAWAKRNKYPTKLQVLCHNCNLAKAFYGECPHKK